MKIKIKFKDVIYLLTILTTVILSKKVFNTEKQSIEKRLAEVCFKYNDNCDNEVGGCVCEVKASKHDVMYILNK
jgi:hypothetical protein